LKRIFLIIIAVVLINQIFGCSATADTPVSKPQGTDCVKVYYFHGFFRCSNCYKIEKYSKEAVDKYFDKELASGELVYEVINTDEKDNEHFIKDYELYTKSLVVSKIQGGEEVEYKNLEKVWDYLRNKEAFYNYVKEEVAKFLKESN